jgi:hypothetical protein
MLLRAGASGLEVESCLEDVCFNTLDIEYCVFHTTSYGLVPTTSHGQYQHASETNRALNIDSLLFNVSLSLLVRR